MMDDLEPTDLSVVKKTEEKAISNIKKCQETESTKRKRSEEEEYETGTLLCNQCNAALPDFESFRNHLKFHLEKTELQYSTSRGPRQDWLGVCPFCKNSNFTAQELIKHISSHIVTTITEYSCQICQKLFNNSAELEKHLMEIHSHHLYLCYTCKEVFDTRFEIQRHFLMKHYNEIKKYSCCICPEFQPIHSEIEFDLHVRTVHCGMESYIETPNNVYVKNESDTKRKHNLAVQSPMTKHSINMSMKRTSTSNIEKKLLEEITKKEKIQNNNNSIEMCGMCESSDFKSEADLTAHRKLVHHKDIYSKVSLQCAYCSEYCKSRSELENHMKLHRQSSLVFGKNKCNICDKICHSSTALAEHKLTHCKVTNGSTCSLCKTVINTEESFINHMAGHNEGLSSQKHQLTLPVSCVICRQTLISESEARLHAKFHLQLQNVQCSVCNKTCVRRDLKENICMKCYDDNTLQEESPTCCVMSKNILKSEYYT